MRYNSCTLFSNLPIHTFRMWFNEDRKGKRKASVSQSNAPSTANVPVPPSPARTRGSFRRRGGWNGSKPRAKRASVSSRRSSSVNSRRSSVTSMQMVLMETPVHGMDHIQRQRSDPSRRSFTPNSEIEREAHSSRPSSIRSYSQNRHRKSPSAGSGGSVARLGRAASPLKQYHRRAGSNSSTRVMRHTRPSHSQNLSSAHVRSNSTASSTPSPASSVSSTMRRTNTMAEIPLPITYTPTTHRISKAKKGKRVHACEFPGCNRKFNVN